MWLDIEEPNAVVARAADICGRRSRHLEADTVYFMPRVDYVIQYVKSLKRSVTFYREVLGLKVRTEGDGYVEFEMDNTKFSLFERSKLPELIGREGGGPPAARSASESTTSMGKRSG